MTSSIWNSASAGEYTPDTGWKTIEICSSTGTKCNAATGSHNYIVNAVTNTGTVGMGARYTTSGTLEERARTSGSTTISCDNIQRWPDLAAPTDGFIPYSGVTSYKEGERTFFTTLTDFSGIVTHHNRCSSLALVNEQPIIHSLQGYNNWNMWF